MCLSERDAFSGSRFQGSPPQREEERWGDPGPRGRGGCRGGSPLLQRPRAPDSFSPTPPAGGWSGILKCLFPHASSRLSQLKNKQIKNKKREDAGDPSNCGTVSACCLTPLSSSPSPPHVALIANWKAGLFHRAILQPTR